MARANYHETWQLSTLLLICWCQTRGKARGAHGGVRAGVEHDEVVAETVHLLEGNTSVQN